MTVSFPRIFLTSLILLSHQVNCNVPSSPVKVPYRLGNFSAQKTVVTSPPPPPPRHVRIREHLLRFWNKHARLFRLGVFLYYSSGASVSIYSNSWVAVRDPDLVNRIRHEGERAIVKQRTTRAELRRKIVGMGYTPRLVWLYGVMLRGIIKCTSLPLIFEPPIGFGAGAVAAARLVHREWLPCIMLGWYGSGFYWRVIFGLDGPPDDERFKGVPITISKIRF